MGEGGREGGGGGRERGGCACSIHTVNWEGVRCMRRGRARGVCKQGVYFSYTAAALYCTLIKKEKKIFLKYKKIQTGAVAKSYIRKGFLIYEEMRKYLTIYEEAVSHI